MTKQAFLSDLKLFLAELVLGIVVIWLIVGCAGQRRRMKLIPPPCLAAKIHCRH